MIESGLDPHLTDTAGVTRLDLVCSQQIGQTAQALARRWGEDRALPPGEVDAIATLVLAAVAYGLRFEPRAVTLAIRWLDLDRILINLRWHGCDQAAVSALDPSDVESTAACFDALSDEWGFGTSAAGPTQWMVVDTR